METDVIDLGKQVFINHSLLIQQCFMNTQMGQINNATYIFYQCNSILKKLIEQPPIQFLIINNFILPDIKLQKIQDQIKQHIIPTTVDFYLENRDPKKLFELFLTFIYTGKIVYRIKDQYYSLLKLAIYFQCDILIYYLINQAKSTGIIRNFFLKFLCDIFNDQIYTQTLFSVPNAQKLLERIIIENSPSITTHTQWHQNNKKDAQEQIKQSFKQVNSCLFNFFVNTYINSIPQKILYLNQFLYFIDKYENPSIKILENIYLGGVYDILDEDYYNLYKDWLTKRCKIELEQLIEKIQNQPFHMQHSKTCDLVNKSFKATCSHLICLNCFFQYLLYRSKFKRQNNKIPQKIRCLTRFINKDICDCVFQDQDFLVLKEYQINELLNLYLKQKI